MRNGPLFASDERGGGVLPMTTEPVARRDHAVFGPISAVLASRPDLLGRVERAHTETPAHTCDRCQEPFPCAPAQAAQWARRKQRPMKTVPVGADTPTGTSDPAHHKEEHVETLTENDSGQHGGTDAFATSRPPVFDAVADRTSVLELTEILRDIDAGLSALAADLERGHALPIETAARVRLLQRRARTSPDGTSYVGRSA